MLNSNGRYNDLQLCCCMISNILETFQIYSFAEGEILGQNKTKKQKESNYESREAKTFVNPSGQIMKQTLAELLAFCFIAGDIILGSS